MSQRIVIVGMAARCGLGSSLAMACMAMRSDSSGMRLPVSLEQRPATPTEVGEVPGVRGSAVDRFRAERLLRGTLLQLRRETSSAAFPSDSRRTAAIIGTTIGGMRHCGAGVRLLHADDVPAALSAFAAMPAGEVLRRSIRHFPIAGLCTTVTCACASALTALTHAVAMLKSGAADAVIAGGYDPISEFVYGGFSALQLVAAGPLAPFAASREGMKLGEGCALFMLRREADARSLGLKIIGAIDGLGESSDAHHLTQPHPEGRGAAAAIRAASGGVLPDLLMAHATGTPANDAAEYAAYQQVYGAELGFIPVAALKSRFGHPLGAAGGMELALALDSASHKVLPAGSGPAPDPAAFPGLCTLRGSSTSGEPRRVLALAAGFGGVNVAVSVDRTPDEGLSADSAGTHATCVAGWGAVMPGGTGRDGVVRLISEAGPAVPGSVIDSLIDRQRTRRIAELPRLVLAAIGDLQRRCDVTPSELQQTPVLCATWHGAVDFTERYYNDLVRSGIDLANPLLFAESVPNIGSAHASLAFGIRAACSSVIGARNAAIHAIRLAQARIGSGAWSQAVVVAAEEAHPTIDAVLRQTHGVPVSSISGAVAVLLRRRVAPKDGIVAEVQSDAWHAPWVHSSSPLDARLGEIHESRLVNVPELGSVTPLAVALLESEGCADKLLRVMSAEPGGGHDSFMFRTFDGGLS
jgi:3-oxoacyl-(acyl-carrier-protein) synthase